MPGHSEEIQNDTVNRKEELSLPWRLEPSHLTFPLSRRLMWNFGAIVGVLFGVMVHRGHDRSECRTVTLQLIGNQAKRNLPLTFQEFAKEALRCTTVASRLDDDVDHVAVLIDGTPQILSFIVDRYEHFVQEPGIAETTLPLSA